MTFYRQVCQKGLVLIISTFTTFINCFQLFFVSCWAPILHSGCVFLSTFHFHYKKWAFLGFTEHCWLLGWLGTMLSHPTGKHVLSATWILNHKQTQASIHFQGNLEMGIFFYGYSRQTDECLLGDLILWALPKQHRYTFMHFVKELRVLACRCTCATVGKCEMMSASLLSFASLWVLPKFLYMCIYTTHVCVSLSPSVSLCLCRVHYWTQ